MDDIKQIFQTEFGLDTDTLIEQLQTFQIDDQTKGAVIANIVFERLGLSRRRFSYQPPLAPEDPDCVPTFLRSLAHADWRNGQDVVDADAFNTRFGAVEDDLDALAEDTAKLFTCLLELRGELATLLDQVRSQINTIHGDIYNIKRQLEDEDPPGGGVFVPPDFGVVPTPPVNPVPPFTPPGGGGIVVPGPINPIGPVVQGGGLVNPGFGTGAGFDPQNTLLTTRGDETIGLIGGMAARRLSATEFNGEPVEVWSTPIGMVLTPVQPEAETEAAYIDPRLELSGYLTGWILENEAEIVERLGDDGFTAGDLDSTFGGKSIGGGLTVGHALGGISSGTRFESTEALTRRFAERQADAVSAARQGTAAVIGALGVAQSSGGVREAELNRFAAIPKEARSILIDRGIDTIEAFNALPPNRTAEVLNAGGFETDLGTVGRWRGISDALSSLR